MNKEFLYQNKKIFYCSIGTGKPVMLLHGFGEDGEVWNTTVDFLKDKFHLIVPDLPGSGKSDLIDDMSVEGMAELMKLILDAEAPLNPPQREASPSPSEGGVLDSDTSKKPYKFEDSKNPPLEGREASPLEGREDSPSEGRGASSFEGRGAIIGHSMGGYIALAFAEKYPEYLSALGLFHSSAYADTEEKKVTRRKGIEFIGQHGAFEFLKTSIPNLFSENSKQQIPNSIRDFIDQQHNFLPEALVSYYEAMMQRSDRTEMLRKSAVPVLFIMGKYDNAVPIADGLEQCHLPGISYIHILRKSGHMGMIEEPEAASRILDEFLLEI